MAMSMSCVKMDEPIEIPFGEWLMRPGFSTEKGTWGIILGHFQTCSQSIFSMLFTNGQEQCGLWHCSDFFKIPSLLKVSLEYSVKYLAPFSLTMGNGQ